ncbi:MAG: hypothetical protein ABW148_12920 [Sedimenticola sp.]
MIAAAVVIAGLFRMHHVTAMFRLWAVHHQDLALHLHTCSYSRMTGITINSGERQHCQHYCQQVMYRFSDAATHLWMLD